jgi:hypothetical protein
MEKKKTREGRITLIRAIIILLLTFILPCLTPLRKMEFSPNLVMRI